MSLPALRARIAEILTPSQQIPGLPTGVEKLDALLPGNGLPIGRLTEMVAPRGGGRTTVLRTVVQETVQRGGWVAVVDASRTLTPRDWASEEGEAGFEARGRGPVIRRGTSRGRRSRPDPDPRPPSPGELWVIRPRRADRGAWCVDLLLRTGGFALVVLDGAAPLPRQVAARLTRLARNAGSALIVAAELPPGQYSGGATLLPGALRLRVERGRGDRRPRTVARDQRRPRVLTINGAAVFGDDDSRIPNAASRIPILITIDKGGTRRTVEVFHAVRVARRLCSHPEVPDRRGVARSGRRPAPGGGAASDATVAGAAHGSTHRPRTRRCAEPVYQRERLVAELPPAIQHGRKQRAGVG